MNNRELVIDTISHIQHERIPYQLDLTEEMEEILLKELGDGFFDSVDNCFALERNEEFEMIGSNRKKDMFGAVWLLDQQGDFGVVENCVMKEPKLSDYIFPQPDEKLIREKCERLVGGENRDRFSMYIIGFSLYERAWSLRGVENLLMDMVIHESFVEELFDRIADYNIAVSRIALEYPIDAIFFGDDWGQQKGLIMGPEYWRKFIKPALGRMYSFVKSQDRFICQHSCGDIYDVFGDLIELGLDIYNTFQPEIYDVAEVKKRYGNHLSFYGGISTQNVLPFGSPDDVRAATRRMMDIMGEGGGYIVAPTHSMPADIPVENIKAFLDVVRN